jgi:hypothetical protein
MIGGINPRGTDGSVEVEVRHPAVALRWSAHIGGGENHDRAGREHPEPDCGWILDSQHMMIANSSVSEGCLKMMAMVPMRKRESMAGECGRSRSRADDPGRGWTRVAAVAVLAMTCVSCGGAAAGLASVTGTVICGGQPAAGAVLSFHRQAGEPAAPRGAAGIIPTASVDEDGHFTVESLPLGYGAAPGKYNILIQWSQDADPAEVRGARKSKTTTIKGKTVTLARPNKLNSIAPDRLNGRYADSANPLLKCEIKEGSNDLGTLEVAIKN